MVKVDGGCCDCGFWGLLLRFGLLRRLGSPTCVPLLFCCILCSVIRAESTSWDVHCDRLVFRPRCHITLHSSSRIGTSNHYRAYPSRGCWTVQQNCPEPVVSYTPRVHYKYTTSIADWLCRTRENSGGRPSGGSYLLNPKIELILPKPGSIS